MMVAAQLVIFDPEADRGCPGNCRRIESLAQQALAPDSLKVVTIDRLAGETHGREPDLVVLRAPAGQALTDVLRPLRQAWRSAAVLGAVCNASHDSSDLLDSLRHGLDDFLRCPFLKIDFVTRLLRLLPDQRPSRAERVALVGDLKLDMLIGESRPLLQALGRVLKVAASDATVLISGETGVGKELFARAIHYNGPRRSRPFIPINCSALPDHLLENELFGHARGAYTDASTSERGLLAEAEGGTVFLDEVDTLAFSSQAKLLRFLQDREYRPLGSSRTLTADVRVIAAANASLRAMVGRRQFREDLYHRLNILSVYVPPLRERASDIPLLANHFLARYAAQYGRADVRLSRAALRKMLGYAWPGNVRELEGLLHRAVVFCPAEILDDGDIELPGVEPAEGAPARKAKDEAMVEFERTYLLNLLADYRGNVSQAAHAAGKDRRTFQRLLRKHRIDRQTFQTLD
jgi:DNA-binding NtrC family response regulator